MYSTFLVPLRGLGLQCKHIYVSSPNLFEYCMQFFFFNLVRFSPSVYHCIIVFYSSNKNFKTKTHDYGLPVSCHGEETSLVPTPASCTLDGYAQLSRVSFM